MPLLHNVHTLESCNFTLSQELTGRYRHCGSLILIIGSLIASDAYVFLVRALITFFFISFFFFFRSFCFSLASKQAAWGVFTLDGKCQLQPVREKRERTGEGKKKKKNKEEDSDGDGVSTAEGVCIAKGRAPQPPDGQSRYRRRRLNASWCCCWPNLQWSQGLIVLALVRW